MDRSYDLFSNATDDGVVECGVFVYRKLQAGPRTENELAVSYFSERLESRVLTDDDKLTEFDNFWYAIAILLKNNKIVQEKGTFYIKQ